MVGIEFPRQLSLAPNWRLAQNVFIGNPCGEEHLQLTLGNSVSFRELNVQKLQIKLLAWCQNHWDRLNGTPVDGIKWIGRDGICNSPVFNSEISGPRFSSISNSQRDD